MPAGRRSDPGTSSTRSSARRDLVVALVLVVGAALTYVAWLGWDHEYQVDAVTGVASGPFEAWQVVGCAATLAVLAAGAGLVGRPGLAVVVLPPAFAAAWSVQASQAGEPNLWPVGALVLAAGVALGAGVVATLAAALRGAPEEPPDGDAEPGR